jgi:hypothetical protein
MLLTMFSASDRAGGWRGSGLPSGGQQAAEVVLVGHRRQGFERVDQPDWIFLVPWSRVVPSAFEALVRFPVVEQVADAVHAVLEDRGGSEDQDAELWIHEGDDVQS